MCNRLGVLAIAVVSLCSSGNSCAKCLCSWNGMAKELVDVFDLSKNKDERYN